MPPILKNILPCSAAWRAASVGDLIAGATVAVTSLPQYIAYAEMAGLPGLRGLQTSGPPLILFSLVTGSPILSVGVTSITAIMAQSALRGPEFKSAHGEDAWSDLLGAFAFLVGLASLILAFVQATRLVAYIPGPVKAGWKLGFALTVMTAQTAGALFHQGPNVPGALCKLPRVPQLSQVISTQPLLYEQSPPLAPISGGAAAVYKFFWMLLNPHLWNWDTVVLSAACLLAVTSARPLIVKVVRMSTLGRVQEPVAGLEVVAVTLLGTLAATTLNYSGSVVGKNAPIPVSTMGTDEGFVFAQILTGWIRQFPWDMPWDVLTDRLGGWTATMVSSFVFAGVNFLAIVSVVESGPLAREMTGQGIACIASGLAGNAPAGGSLSRSLVAKMTGASSPLAGLVNGLTTMALASPLMEDLLASIPKAILSAVVLAAVLPSVIYPADLLQMHGRSAFVAWFTAGTTALTNPTTGFVMGTVAYCSLHVASISKWDRTTPRGKKP